MRWLALKPEEEVEAEMKEKEGWGSWATRGLGAMNPWNRKAAAGKD